MLLLDWEDDEGLNAGITLETLPGRGATFCTLGIEGENKDVERVLQESRFRGGGDQSIKIVPPKLKAAFDKWYERLMNG